MWHLLFLNIPRAHIFRPPYLTFLNLGPKACYANIWEPETFTHFHPLSLSHAIQFLSSYYCCCITPGKLWFKQAIFLFAIVARRKHGNSEIFNKDVKMAFFLKRLLIEDTCQLQGMHSIQLGPVWLFP